VTVVVEDHRVNEIDLDLGEVLSNLAKRTDVALVGDRFTEDRRLPRLDDEPPVWTIARGETLGSRVVEA
jgi:hypothetical protein